MRPTSFTVASGSHVLLLADFSEPIRALARGLEQRCQLRVEHLSGTVTAETFERYSGVGLILAAPETFGRILPGLASTVLRWRHLIFLVERAQLLTVAAYAKWADGYLFLDQAADRCAALELAGEGLAVLPPYLVEGFSLDAMRAENLDALDRMELRVLACLSTGMPNAQIGEQLALSQANVKSQVRSLLSKMRFRNRTEAGVFARLNEPRVRAALAGDDLLSTR